MNKCIILRNESQMALETAVEKFANKYSIEHLSFSTIVFPDFSVEYSCCLIYK